MIKGRVPKVVRDQCREWAIKMKIPAGQYPILLELAVKSYKNLSISERDAWSLEEVIKQHL